MSQNNGVFRVLAGILSEKPRSTNPYRAWAPGKQWGFRGFILIQREFFKSDKDKKGFYSYPPGNFFLRTKIIHKNPDNPVFPAARLSSTTISHTRTSNGATNTHI